MHWLAVAHPFCSVTRFEAVLHVAARDGVERTGEPVGERALEAVAVGRVGARLALGVGLHVLLEGLAEGGHVAASGALGCGVLAHGDDAEQPVGLTAGVLCRHPVAAADDEALVGRGPAARAEAVIDNVGLDAGGMDEDAVSGQPVVPCDPWLIGRLEAVDGALSDCELDACGAFSGAWHWSNDNPSVIGRCQSVDGPAEFPGILDHARLGSVGYSPASPRDRIHGIGGMMTIRGFQINTCHNTGE